MKAAVSHLIFVTILVGFLLTPLNIERNETIKADLLDTYFSETLCCKKLVPAIYRSLSHDEWSEKVTEDWHGQ